VQHLGKILIVWRRNPDSKSDEAGNASRQRASRQRRPQAAATERRDESSGRSRVAPPSGAPRAPSRRRRAEVTEATDSRVSDQSRRRRRPH